MRERNASLWSLHAQNLYWTKIETFHFLSPHKVGGIYIVLASSLHTFFLSWTISQYLLVRFDSFLVQMISSIPARSHTFVEFDHEIISTVILLPSADSFKKGCCQLQAKVCAQITGYPLVQACPGKSVVRWTDRPAMTIAVDLGRKATKPTNQQMISTMDYRYLMS